jgi:hypothetical protein
MDVQPDFRELLALFNSHDVDYVIVDASALALHGAPRATGDLDVLVNPTPEMRAPSLPRLKSSALVPPASRGTTSSSQTK